jgi:hypothetical protein
MFAHLWKSWARGRPERPIGLPANLLKVLAESFGRVGTKPPGDLPNRIPACGLGCSSFAELVGRTSRIGSHQPITLLGACALVASISS